MRGAGEIGVLRRHQRGDELRHALAEQRGEHQREQDRRKRQLQVDDAHDEGFDPPAEIGRARAEHGAEHERHRAGRDADLDRDAQAIEDRREEIAALRVGAEDVHVAAGPDKPGGRRASISTRLARS